MIGGQFRAAVGVYGLAGLAVSRLTRPMKIRVQVSLTL